MSPRARWRGRDAGGSRSGARAGGSPGFTLTELLISVSILTLVIGVLASALVLGFRTTSESQDLLAAGHTREMVLVTFPRDALQSATAEAAGDITTAMTNGTGNAALCVDASLDSPVARLGMVDGSTSPGTPRLVVYATQGSGSGEVLVRRECTLSGGSWQSGSTLQVAGRVSAAQLDCYDAGGTNAGCGTGRELRLTITDFASTFSAEGWQRSTSGVADVNAPTVDNPGDQDSLAQQPINPLQIAAAGVPPLTFSAVGLPSGLSIDPAQGIVQGTPTVPGDNLVTVRVTDANGNTAATDFYWNVWPVAEIQSEYTGSWPQLCLDEVNDALGGAGTAVVVYACNGNPAQQWSVPGDGTIRSNGLCLNPQNDGTANVTHIVLDPCDGRASEQWSWQQRNDGGPAYMVYNPNSGRCLDDDGWGTTDNNPVIIWDCKTFAANNYNQQWTLP